MYWKRLLKDVLTTSWKKTVATSISDQSKTSLRTKLKTFYDVFTTSLCRLGSLLRKLRFPLLKSFIRSCLDYGDIIYDQVYTVLFYQKIESVQYNSVLAITGAIRGTSKEKLYQEPGWKPLKIEDITGNCTASLKYSSANL